MEHSAGAGGSSAKEPKVQTNQNKKRERAATLFEKNRDKKPGKVGRCMSTLTNPR